MEIHVYLQYILKTVLFLLLHLHKNNEQVWPLHEVYISVLGSGPNFNVLEYRTPIHQT